MGDAADDFLGGYNEDRGLPGSHWAPLAAARSARARVRLAELEVIKARTELEQLEEARAERFGPEREDGTVIRFGHRFSDSSRDYGYAAIRAGAMWYLTGREGSQPRTWTWLCDFIGDAVFDVFPAGFHYRWSVPAQMRGFIGDAEFTSTTRTALLSDDLSPTERELAKVRPFIVSREPNAGRWQVLDERLSGDAHPAGSDIVETFPSSGEGRERARRSVADRNRAVQEAMLRLEIEPPVRARVCSADPVGRRRKWARRQEDGWVRYHGDTIQAVRLSWDSLRRQLRSMTPGSWNSMGLFPDESA